MIVIEDQHRPIGHRSVDDVIRGQNRGGFPSRNRSFVLSSDTVPPPVAARRQNDSIGTEFEDLIDFDLALQIDLDVVELLDLADAPVTYARPFCEAG